MIKHRFILPYIFYLCFMNCTSFIYNFVCTEPDLLDSLIHSSLVQTNHFNESFGQSWGLFSIYLNKDLQISNKMMQNINNYNLYYTILKGCYMIRLTQMTQVVQLSESESII